MYKRKRPLRGRSLVIYLIGPEPIIKRFWVQFRLGYISSLDNSNKL